MIFRSSPIALFAKLFIASSVIVGASAVAKQPGPHGGIGSGAKAAIEGAKAAIEGAKAANDQYSCVSKGVANGTIKTQRDAKRLCKATP